MFGGLSLKSIDTRVNEFKSKYTDESLYGNMRSALDGAKGVYDTAKLAISTAESALTSAKKALPEAETAFDKVYDTAVKDAETAKTKHELDTRISTSAESDEKNKRNRSIILNISSTVDGIKTAVFAEKESVKGYLNANGIGNKTFGLPGRYPDSYHKYSEAADAFEKLAKNIRAKYDDSMKSKDSAVIDRLKTETLALVEELVKGSEEVSPITDTNVFEALEKYKGGKLYKDFNGLEAAARDISKKSGGGDGDITLTFSPTFLIIVVVLILLLLILHFYFKHRSSKLKRVENDEEEDYNGQSWY